jgi:hypothetical protein
MVVGVGRRYRHVVQRWTGLARPNECSLFCRDLPAMHLDGIPGRRPLSLMADSTFYNHSCIIGLDAAIGRSRSEPVVTPLLYRTACAFSRRVDAFFQLNFPPRRRRHDCQHDCDGDDAREMTYIFFVRRLIFRAVGDSGGACGFNKIGPSSSSSSWLARKAVTSLLAPSKTCSTPVGCWTDQLRTKLCPTMAA